MINQLRLILQSGVRLMVPFVLFCAIGSVRGQVWTQTSAPVKSWYSIASSADGNKLVAVASGDGIYTSTNFGATWVLSSAPNKSWRAVASSANGSNLVAAATFGGVYTSTNAGATWTSNNLAGNHDWSSAASSADGNRLVVGASTFGYIYTSTNAGATWISNSPPSGYWTSVVSSGDGSQLAAAWSGSVYSSKNGGSSWNSNAPPVFGSILALATDGSIMVMPFSSASFYTSTDLGATWTQRTLPGAGSATGAALSANGAKLAAFGKIYTTTNGGASWNPNNASGLNWSDVASSADGGKFAAVVKGGGIYSFYDPTPPRLNLSLSSNYLAFTWLLPSTNFVLQQSPDLISWSSITDAPTLNPTNLNYVLTLLPTNTGGFYRLATP